MFDSFGAFIHYIESFPPLYVTFEEREASLLKAKAWMIAQDLVPRVPIVTVTGTNGKGSTVKALSEILVNHGLNVCAFTSPHLISYTERFSYNLDFVDEATLLRLANRLAALIDISQWNFFFILFFMQLLLCKELVLDCLILEVGIGGRLDPTNILDASIVILTQVALDHTHILGDTREAIGFEKSALLRGNIPFICGDLNPPATVTQTAIGLYCPFYQLNKQFGFYVRGNRWDVWFDDGMFGNLPLPMIHLGSLSCALQAAKLLFPSIQFTQAFMETQLPTIYLPARYQRMMLEETEVVVDVSHNPAAVEALATFLQFLPAKHTVAIFGGKETKDMEGIIALMKNVVDDWYLVPVDGVHGMNTETLAEFFGLFSIGPHCALNVEDAMQKIIAKKIVHTRIVAFGSFHVAGPMLVFLQAQLSNKK